MSDDLLAAVCEALDVIVRAAQPYEGLVPSMIDRETGAMLTTIPEAVPGQRATDRSHFGSNLLDDVPLLDTLDLIAEATARPGYRAVADRYVARFATHCTRTPTGLFPWGEHAYWHLLDDRPGNSREYPRDDPGLIIHDHTNKAPPRLWERIHVANPEAVHAFADGLRYQYNDPNRPEYNRHAYLLRKDRYPIRDRSCDFPRYGSYYLLDWAFAYTCEDHPEYCRQIRQMADYWWGKRYDEAGGLLSLESRGRDDELSGGQTLATAISFLEAAALLGQDEPELAAILTGRAETYVDGFFAIPQDPDTGTFVTSCRQEDLEAGTFTARTDAEYELKAQPTWVRAYGGGSPIAGTARSLLTVFQLTGREACLDFARTVGEHYLEHPFPPGGTLAFEDASIKLEPSTRGTLDDDDEIPVRAGDVATVIGLFCDLAEHDGSRWQSPAAELAHHATEVYCDAPLPRATVTMDHYESHLGGGQLLKALARTALLK